MLFCHQLTLGVYRFAKTGQRKLPEIREAAVFAKLLKVNRSLVGDYDARRAIPPALYDVFGCFDAAGRITHSAIVVQAAPEPVIAELAGNKVQQNPLSRMLRPEEGVSLYTAPVLRELHAMIPHYVKLFRLV